MEIYFGDITCTEYLYNFMPHAVVHVLSSDLYKLLKSSFLTHLTIRLLGILFHI